ncbi:unnamed protein product [Mycena citricolor]|uniref:Uncharacterized protein n=1 Tax=Mycena citricolor TaxID=2018698 RepID=A0AAD2Q1W8_9AGAR|nr:unnamed protein product [Mycena citricolor]
MDGAGAGVNEMPGVASAMGGLFPFPFPLPYAAYPSVARGAPQLSAGRGCAHAAVARRISRCRIARLRWKNRIAPTSSSTIASVMPTTAPVGSELDEPVLTPPMLTGFALIADPTGMGTAALDGATLVLSVSDADEAGLVASADEGGVNVDVNVDVLAAGGGDSVVDAGGEVVMVVVEVTGGAVGCIVVVIVGVDASVGIGLKILVIVMGAVRVNLGAKCASFQPSEGRRFLLYRARTAGKRFKWLCIL